VRAPNTRIGEHVSYIFNFKISDDMHAWLKEFAQINEMTQSQVCREALQMYRDRYTFGPEE